MIVRRVLVALDASPGGRTAVEATARLAARLHAELVGLFIEDDRLLRLADSPLSREVDTLTAVSSQPGGLAARRQLRLQGVRAREELERAADREGVSWSFHVSRGPVSSEIADAVEETDIVGLGPVGWSHRPQKVLGRVASEVLGRRRGCTLLVRRSVDVRPPVVVLCDGSEQATRALVLAERLLGDTGETIRVHLVGASKEALEQSAEATLENPRLVSIVGRDESADDRRIAAALAAQAPGTLLVPLGGALAGEDALQELVDRIDCPVLVVS